MILKNIYTGARSHAISTCSLIDSSLRFHKAEPRGGAAAAPSAAGVQRVTLRVSSVWRQPAPGALGRERALGAD